MRCPAQTVLEAVRTGSLMTPLAAAVHGMLPPDEADVCPVCEQKLTDPEDYVRHCLLDCVGMQRACARVYARAALQPQGSVGRQRMRPRVGQVQGGTARMRPRHNVGVDNHEEGRGGTEEAQRSLCRGGVETENFGWSCWGSG